LNLQDYVTTIERERCSPGFTTLGKHDGAAAQSVMQAPAQGIMQAPAQGVMQAPAQGVMQAPAQSVMQNRRLRYCQRWANLLF
jgi:hypothetical protein